MNLKALYSGLTLCILTLPQAFTQAFIQPVETIPSLDCQLTLNDGSEINGTVRTALMVGGSVRSINIKDENGEIHKYKAGDVQTLKVKMSGLAKLEAISEGSESLAELADLDFNEIINREYVIYEQALLAKKKDKYALLQLLNPGFDERLKVYLNPTGQETAGVAVGDLQLTGGNEKSYLVVKDGSKSMKVKKGSYKKDFSELFGDCAEMLKAFSGGRIKFGDMASHVLYYNKHCMR